MVHIKNGMVEGINKDGCMVYMGIPYALPPMGSLAFKHPVPAEPWEGVLKCDHGSHNPIQSHDGYFVENASLDSLYLNVFVPEDIGDKKLAVMFWIYGGAFAQGGAGAVSEGSTTLCYNMERFAVDSNTIVVSCNYRLGVLGFLNFNSLCSDFDVNNGLYDQLLALKWVNDNIGAFGGDSDNITIFGESAGAASVLALMSMREADGLYQRAIVQSACIDHFFTYEESAANARMYLKIAGVNKASEILNMTQEHLDKSVAEYAKKLKLKGDIRVPFSPVIDGKTLVDHPNKLAKKSNIPLLIGTNKCEGNMFMLNIKTWTIPFTTKLLGLDMQPDDPDYRQRASNAITRAVFTEPLDRFLEGYEGKAYRYEYTYYVEGSSLGCSHASELHVMLAAEKTIDGVPIDPDDPIGLKIRRIWGQFAYTGNPGWSEYSDGNNTFII